LTLATCRATHPDWPIYVYDIADDIDWGIDDDFTYNQKDYREEAKKVLGCEFKLWTPTDPVIKEMPPQNQSDLFSYAILCENGGWYSDTDVLFLRSHQFLSDADYAFCGFGGSYYHVGMFGSVKGGWAIKSILDTSTGNYDSGSYNSTGTYAILKHNAGNEEWNRKFKEPDNGLRNYHLPDWTWVSVFPQEHAKMLREDFTIDGNALALHLYGSLPTFQSLNRKLNPQTITDEGNVDVVSRTVRKMARQGDRGIFLV
jgi:hypothetical protein